MKLYDYQKTALQSCKANTKGIVCLPTGTGKTIVEAALIQDALTAKPGFGIYVVNASRIVLCKQLLGEIAKFIIKGNINVRLVSLHSGKKVSNREILELRAGLDMQHTDIVATTSTSELREAVANAQANNQPIIIFSTYHSCQRIHQAKLAVDLLINDEAHYLIQESHNEEFTKINAARKYFFTATTRVTPGENTRGMNNAEMYGTILPGSITPLEAISKGKMVRPRMLLLKDADNALYTREDLINNVPTIISRGFSNLRTTLKLGNPKMLVAAAGTKDIGAFLDSDDCTEMIENGVKVYAISSNEDIQCQVNKQIVDRDTFLSSLKTDGANPATQMVVLHFDILTEGIDVPGLNGLLLLRDMTKSKFLQSYGRISRLDIRDKEAVDAGTIQPSELKKLKKPYAYVMLPYLSIEDEDTKTYYRGLINEMRSIGFNPSEDVVLIDNGAAWNVVEGPDSLNRLDTNAGATNEMLEELISEIETEEEANLSINLGLLDQLAA